MATKTKKGKHTPTPWYIEGTGDDVLINDLPETDSHRSSIALVYSDGIDSELPNAEFIVKAVNSHDDLLKACKMALNLIGQSGKIDFDGDVTPLLVDAIEKAEAK